MKRIYALLFLIIPFICWGQNGKDLYPTIEKTYNEKDAQIFEQNWERCTQIWSKKDHVYTNEETNFIKNNCDETMGSYWQTTSDGCSWYCGGGPYKITASSTLPPQNNNSYGAHKAHDGMTNTAWVEGVPGNGIGEYLEYSFRTYTPRITVVKIATGYLKSQKAFNENTRAKTIKMVVNNELHSVFHLQDSRTLQVFNVDTLFNIKNEKDSTKIPKEWVVKFIISEIYPGSKYEDLAISEISFDGVDVHCFAKGTMVTLADSTEIAIENITNSHKILSFDLTTQSFFADSIIELAQVKHSNIITISFIDGMSIRCTTDHPFLSNENKWVSFDPSSTQQKYKYNSVEKLEIGTSLLTLNGENEIDSIESSTEAEEMYTIVRLANGKTFIANNIIVGTEELK